MNKSVVKKDWSMAEILNLRTTFEEITENFTMPEKGSHIDIIKWFIEEGYKSNSLRDGFDEALMKMPNSRQIILKAALSNSRAFKLALRKSKNLLLSKVKKRLRFIAFGEVLIRWPMHRLASFTLWPKVLEQLSGGKLIFPLPDIEIV